MRKSVLTNLLLFTKHLSISLKSGMTLAESLEMIEDQAKGPMKKIVKNILTDIETGNNFNQSLAKYPKVFSPVFVSMVKIGEVSGTLEKSLNQLSDEIRKSYEMKKKVKGAMMYPMIVLIAVLGLGFSIAIFVLPKIIPLFSIIKSELPITTKALIFIANAFETNGLMISVVTFTLVAGLIILTKQNFVKPFTHRLLVVIPGLKNIVKNVNMVRFSMTFGTLLSRGVTVDESLNITADSIDNRIYKSGVRSLIPEIQKGNSISDALEPHKKIFPKMVIKMIGVGERTGNLETIIEYLGDFYQREVDSTLKNLSTILEPVLLIMIGLVVGGVAMSILSPIYEITGNLN